MRSRLAPGLLLLVLLASACGDNSSESDTPSTDKPTSSESVATTTDPTADSTMESPSTTGPTSTAETASPAVCDPYLDLLSAQDGAQRNTALGRLREGFTDQSVLSALDTLEQSEDVESVFAADEVLRTAVLPLCRDAYYAEVVGTDPDNVAAAFFSAIRTGNRDEAVPLAPANVLALFGPWEPLTPDADVGSPVMTLGDNGSFNMVLAPTVTVYCTTDGGVVDSCSFGE